MEHMPSTDEWKNQLAEEHKRIHDALIARIETNAKKRWSERVGTLAMHQSALEQLTKAFEPLTLEIFGNPFGPPLHSDPEYVRELRTRWEKVANDARALLEGRVRSVDDVVSGPLSID